MLGNFWREVVAEPTGNQLSWSCTQFFIQFVASQYERGSMWPHAIVQLPGFGGTRWCGRMLWVHATLVLTTVSYGRHCVSWLWDLLSGSPNYRTWDYPELLPHGVIVCLWAVYALLPGTCTVNSVRERKLQSCALQIQLYGTSGTPFGLEAKSNHGSAKLGVFPNLLLHASVSHWLKIICPSLREHLWEQMNEWVWYSRVPLQ